MTFKKYKKVTNENTILDYKKILEIEPDNIEAYYNCNRLEDGSYEDIKDFVEKIIEKDSQNAIAFAYRGFCNSQLGYRKNAVEDFEKALELAPDEEKIYELIENCDDPETRALVYEILVKRNSDDISATKREIYALHDCCIKHNNFLFCKESYCRERLYSSNNVDFGEDTAEINRLKEECYKILNQENDEIKIEQVPELCEFEFDDLPEELSYDDCIESCEKYYESGDYQDAIGIYDAYIKTHPQFENNEIELYLKRGICHYKMENHKKALQDFNKFITLSQRNECSQAYLYRGLVYLDKKEYKKAYADFEKAEQCLENGLKDSDDTISDMAIEIDMVKKFANILMEN